MIPPEVVPTAPWWGVAVIAGVFAAGGVCATLLANFLRDRRDYRRRWERNLRLICAQMLSSAMDVALTPVEQSDTELGLSRKRAMLVALSEVTLLADHEVRTAATVLMAVASEQANVDDSNRAVVDKTTKLFQAATDVFVAAARKSLGIKLPTDPLVKRP